MTTPLALEDPIVRELQAAVTGRYGLERELGRGGMGAVFLARDLRLDRLVAIKVLPPELAVRPELRERFLRETRTAASFSHPNIVPVHGVEESAALLFFVMGYVEGETLTQRVRRQGPLEVAVATRMLREIAWALSYAHGRGVVHRDIKPDNILLERGTGRALVMDFGISRSAAASGLTQVGESLGTPHFMSPEQAAGETADGRSDLYSLGVTAFYALTGALPFDGPSARAVMAMHLSQPAPAVAARRPDVPTALSAAIDRCLAKAPDDRFPTGEALVEALEQLQSRQVEVPPSIRVWTVRADQFLRNGMILALVLPQFIKFGAQEARAIFGAVVFTVLVPALWAQIPASMRELARQGIGYAELRSGILAIDLEREGVLAAMRADPRYARRQRAKWFVLIGGILLSIGIIVLGLKTAAPKPTGGYLVSSVMMTTMFLALVLGMVCFVFIMATLSGSGRLDRRLHRVWTGPIGRRLFQLAVWRLPDAPRDRTALGASSGAATLLSTLPSEHRRVAGAIRKALATAATRLDAVERKDRELLNALGEVGGPADTTGKQAALRRELETARQSLVDERGRLGDAIESARLGIIRARTGLGSLDDVLGELERVLTATEA